MVGRTTRVPSSPTSPTLPGPGELRRLDWRFLLGRAIPRRVLYVGPARDSLVRSLTAYGVEMETRGPGDVPSQGAYDLVVLQEPGAATLRRLPLALSGDAVIYGEMHGRSIDRRQVRRVLAEVGFRSVRWFWHHPGFEECRRIVGSSSAGALRYALAGKGGGFRSLMGSMAAPLTRWGATGDLVPSASFVATWNPDVSGAVRDAAAGFLVDSWDRLHLHRFGRPEELEGVLVTPRFLASAHVVSIFVDRATARPVLVVKAPRAPHGEPALAREAENLRALREKWPECGDSVPELLAFERHEGTPLLLETGLDGSPLTPASLRRAPEAGLRAILEWVAALGAHTAQVGDHREAWVRSVARPLDAWEPWFPDHSTDRALAIQTRRLTSALAQHPVPLVVEHGDLSAPNLLLDRSGGLQVVDWELAEPSGLPAVDLFFALQFVASARARATSTRDHARAFGAAFFGPDAWALPHVDRYAVALGLPPRMLTPLFLAACSRWATRLPERWQAAGARVDGVRLQRNRFRALWEHAVLHRERLVWDVRSGGGAAC